MALYIVEADCISCGDCEPVCPTKSIKEGKIVFEINPATCSECDGDFDEPQCKDICPVDNCILPLAS
jgi:ferredoxin